MRAGELEQPQSADACPRRRWRDASIDAKIAVLIVLAALGGAAAVGLDAALGHPVWPLALLLTAAVLGPLSLAHHSLTRPLRELLHELHRACRHQRPTPEASLAASRHDEIGQLAHLMHRQTLQAYRHARAAKHLRRTLDHRVTRATRHATRHLQQMAMRDPLTGLGNRRFLAEHLDELISSCRASETDLICLAIDLDHFKAMNDTLGHAAGDQLLQLLAQLIRANIRHDDLAIRLGGDEFLVLLPGAELRPAARLAHHLRQLFGQHVRTTLPRQLNTGLSIGLASLEHDQPATGEDLIHRADQRLYAAKANGKNQLTGLPAAQDTAAPKPATADHRSQ